VTHRLTVEAPAKVLYDLVADATRWPVLFGPTVHVDILERSASAERFAIWATGGAAVVGWTSSRTFEPDAPRVSFRQEHSAPPISFMGGSWEFHETGDNATEVLLEHSFACEPGAEDQIEAILDRNSTAELAALRQAAELSPPIFQIEDSVEFTGSPADAFAFLDDAGAWPRRLPHVAALDLTQEAGTPGQPAVQRMTMHTSAPDGSTHSTSSIRLCTPGERIVYKQVTPPAILLGHHGSWHITARPGGGTITAHHLGMLDPRGLGDEPPAAAVQRVAAALRTNSHVTMEHAAAFASRGR
jgi:aromatase